MYIETVPNRTSPPAILLRESHRDGTATRKRTLANLSHLPPDAIDVAFGRIAWGVAGALEPGVLVGGVADDQLSDDLESAVVGGVEEFREVVDRAVRIEQPGGVNQVTLLLRQRARPSASPLAKAAMHARCTHSGL